MLLMDLLLGVWRPPTPSRSRIHRLLGSNSKSSSMQMFARVRIMAALTDEWKTNKQIASDTGLQLNTVQQKTAKMHTSGKIDKITRKECAETKPVCLYKLKK